MTATYGSGNLQRAASSAAHYRDRHDAGFSYISANNNERMRRREFIGIAAAGVAGLVWPASARDANLMSALAYPGLLGVVRDESVVRDLGRRCREMSPSEDDRLVLMESILTPLRAAPDAPLRVQVKDQVQRDFSAGDTITLNGWI